MQKRIFTVKLKQSYSHVIEKYKETHNFDDSAFKRGCEGYSQILHVSVLDVKEDPVIFVKLFLLIVSPSLLSYSILDHLLESDNNLYIGIYHTSTLLLMN